MNKKHYYKKEKAKFKEYPVVKHHFSYDTFCRRHGYTVTRKQVEQEE